jgi:hypothetical protein
MKYICLGYIKARTFEGMTEDERHAGLDECFEYNDHLRANGHLVAELPLQPPETALTLYWKNGKVATTDGPNAETREQLGGIQILEERDLNHAVQPGAPCLRVFCANVGFHRFIPVGTKSGENRGQTGRSLASGRS